MSAKMPAKRKKKTPTHRAAKASVRNRTVRHVASHPEESGAPFNDQDVQRRLGDFVGAGEHARKGGRTSGIVGQTTKKLHTDKRAKN